MNPYEELGVQSDATDGEIHTAYRRRAAKTHPDAGGSAEAFAHTTTALAVLTDPVSRKRFDETGEVREEPIDTLRSSALQAIEMLLGQAINDYVMAKFAPEKDPRTADLIVRFVRQLNEAIEKDRETIKGLVNNRTFLRDLRDRFSLNGAGDSNDPVRRSIENQIRARDAAIEGTERNIAAHQMAIDILDGYDFRREQPVSTSFFISGFTLTATS